jgi:hypothetical protein
MCGRMTIVFVAWRSVAQVARPQCCSLKASRHAGTAVAKQLVHTILSEYLRFFTQKREGIAKCAFVGALE